MTAFSTSPDGTHVAYDVTGSGPALVLLHGAGKTRRDWHELGYVERLARDFTIVAVDVRGSGESDRPLGVGDYAIDVICQDLYAIADACSIQRFAVWGYSFGGDVARHLGAHSDRVTAIAVIGVPFGPAVDEGLAPHVEKLEKKWGAAIRAYHEGTLTEKERRALLRRQTPVWLPCFQAMRAWPDVVPADMRCPALLVVGTRNRVAMAWVKAHRQALDEAGIHVSVIEGLNHSQEFDEVDCVFPVVSSFFKRSAGL